MKKLILLQLFGLCLAGIYSQDYKPFVDTTKLWSNMITDYTQGGIQVTYYIRFQGDTVINDTGYLKTWRSFDTTLIAWECCGFAREEMDSKQVFFRNLSGEEGLMYDFGLNAGDTVSIRNYYDTFSNPEILAYCLEKDSVLIGDDFHDRYKMYFGPPEPTDNFYGEYWVEGIGSDHGTLGAGFSQITGNSLSSLCYWENDELLYSTPLNQCIVYGDDLCPHFLDQQLDTAYIGEYYEYQLKISNCSSDSIKFYRSFFPTFLDLDESTGIISGTPPITTFETQYLEIYLVNWRFPTDYKLFTLTVLEPVNISEPSENDKKINCYFSNDGQLCIDMEEESQHWSDFSIEIFSMNGNQIHTHHCSSSVVPVQIDVTTWPPGIYIAVVYSDGSARGKVKFVVR